MMQADLAKIGVNAKLVTYEWGEYRKRAQGGEDMTAQLGWTGDNGDPDNFFFLDGCTDGKPASNNIPKWCNAEFNDLLAKARTIPDQAERAKLYTRMQEIEHDEQPELLLAHSTVFEAMRANVTGYKQSPLGTHAFEGPIRRLVGAVLPRPTTLLPGGLAATELRLRASWRRGNWPASGRRRVRRGGRALPGLRGRPRGRRHSRRRCLLSSRSPPVSAGA